MVVNVSDVFSIDDVFSNGIQLDEVDKNDINQSEFYRVTSQSILNGRGYVTPSWETVKAEIRWLFLLHAYGFACSFFILAFYAFFSILNIRSLLTSRPFMSTINVFLCLLGATRASSLFIDPYNLKETMPRYFGSVLWDIGYPSITSAFALVQLAFLQLTQLKLGPEKMRNKSCLSLIITSHFACVIATDIVITFHNHLYSIKYTTQAAFLVWGIFLCCTFLCAGYRVMALLRHMSGVLLQRDTGESNYKGIMQLAMLAPYNNLATSVAAALVPTLLRSTVPISNESKQNFTCTSDTQPEASASTSKSSNSTNHQIPVCRTMSNNSSTTRKWPNDVSETVYSRLDSSPSTSRHNSVLKMTQSHSREMSNLSNEQNSDLPKLKKNLSWRTDERMAAELLNRTKISFKQRKPKEEKTEEDQVNAETTLLSQSQTTKISFKQRKPKEEKTEEDQVNAETTLLSQSQTCNDPVVPDLTLQTILNHIAYVNRAATQSESGLASSTPQATPASRKKQVTTVLHITYATALLGLILCIADIFLIFGPYGIFASESGVRPWPWFCFQTVCRAVELAMGCAMANITKQPVTHRHHYLRHQYGHSIRIKHESLFM